MIPIVMGAIAAASSVYQVAQGASQKRRGQRGLDALERPEYEIPAAVRQMLALTQNRASDAYMPGQGIASDSIGSTTANGMSAAMESGNPYAALGAITSNANQAYNNLAINSAQYQNQENAQYLSTLGTMANFQDTEWQMNQFAPYKDNYLRFNDMIGAGIKNIHSGIGDISSLALSVLNADTATPTVDQSALDSAYNAAASKHTATSNLNKIFDTQYYDPTDGNSDSMNANAILNIILNNKGIMETQ